MQNLVFTQLSIVEVGQIFRRELETFYKHTRTLEDKQGSELIPIEEAADILRISVENMRIMARRNQIPHFRKGDEYFFLKVEILDYSKTQAA